MNTDTISDSDLRQALVDHGVEVGPITPTTRNVYRKKLERMSLSHGEITTTTTTTMQSYTEEINIEPQHNKTYREQENHYYQTKSVDNQRPVNVEPVRTPRTSSEPTAHITNSESPYRYAIHDHPSGDNLKRRPLYTPGGTLRTVPLTKLNKSKPARTVDHVDRPKTPKATKSSFPWCRLLMFLLMIVLLLVLLVYYHMEQNHPKELPLKE